MAKDYYDSLGVARNASKEEIRQAYRKLAKQYHPDVNHKKEAEGKFKEISEAYAVLSNDEKKKQYDSMGTEQFRKKYDDGYIYQGFNFQDVFDDLGPGDLREVMQFFFQNPSMRQASVGKVMYVAELGLEHILKGAVVKLSYKTLEKSSLFNNVYVEKEHSLEVTVPPGVADGKILRLRGAGSKTATSAEDLYVQVKMKPDERFSRDGNNLYLEQIVEKEKLVPGNTIRIQDLEDMRIAIKIPQNYQSGKPVRLKGQGLPDFKTKKRGDLIVYLRGM